MKFAFIQTELGEYPIRASCRFLGVSASGYFAWRKRRPSARAQADAKLAERIAQVFQTNRRVYGSPRVMEVLRREGTRVGRKRIARLMRSNGLYAKTRRRFKVTTDSNHTYAVAPNVLARRFDGFAPGEALVSDGTFIATGEGWLYLVVVIDLGSRAVVGHAMSERFDVALVKAALEMAVARAKIDDDAIFHSDRGVQYAAPIFQEALRTHRLLPSMSRVGDCFDNAVAESFNSTLKSEGIGAAPMPSRAAARARVFEFIEVFYNRQRLHSSIGYKTPFEVLNAASRG